MAAIPFRPTVSGLEDRITPAITPTDVFAAVQQVESAEATLRTLSSQLGQVRGVYAQQFAIAALPALSAQSTQSLAVLAEFRGALEAQIAADPASLAPFLGPYVGATQKFESRAVLAVGYADLFAQGFQSGLTGQPAVAPTTPNTTPTDTPTTDPTDDGSVTDPTTDPTDGTPTIDPDTGVVTVPGTVDPGTPDPGTADPGTTDPGTTDPTTSDPTQAGLSTTIPDLTAPEWQTTASGLRIWDVTTGTGDVVQPGDTVTVDYIGWLTDGTSFDSSVSRGQPSTFSLNQVIQGWVEGIPGMREGGIRRLDIPANLAYGNNPPSGSSIPPGADLVFEIQMIAVA